MLSPDIIDRVREATDIVELVSGYVNLQKRGINFFGLCPFHSEKTPSFSVNAEKQIFHCFGCSEGGNAITFLMKIEKLSFIESVEQLAKKSGISLPRSKGETGTRTNLYEITDKTARIFHNQLLKNPEAEVARQYLKQRQMAREIITDFMIGYALDEWEGILKSFRSVKDYEKVLEQVGLAIPRENGRGYYDRFRHRITFPIRNESGRVVGFGGRRLREEEQAKYINSPETIIYQKSNVLYGLFENREAIRQAGAVIIVEGYIDLLSVCQGGFKNIVATLGTALTPAQVGVLARYTNRIILLFDSDDAGLKATLRGIETVLNRGLDVEIALLEKGFDPDNYMKKYGPEGFQKVLDNRLSLPAFWASLYKKENIQSSVAAKTQLVKGIIQVLAKVEDSIYQNILVRAIAEQFGMSELTLSNELHKVVVPHATTKPQIKTDVSQNILQSPEWDLVRLLLSRQELRDFILSHCPPEYFRDADARLIMENIHHLHQERKNIIVAELIDILTEPKQQNIVATLQMEPFQISKELLEHSAPYDYWDQACKQIIGLKIKILDEKLKEIGRQIMEREKRGEHTMELMREQIKISREIQHLRREGINDLKNF